MSACAQDFLIGVICPVGWSERDEVNKYSIFTSHDEDIILRGAGVKRNFSKHRNKKVKVFGRFLSSNDDVRVFKVTKTTLEKNVA